MRFLSFTFLSLLLLAGCGGRPQKTTAPTPSFDNLILIVIDTLRADHLPAYGYERDTAPFLSRLADEGWQIDGYSASSWTRSSMATLFTGLHPQRHQTTGRDRRLPAESPFLAELLRGQGLQTAAWVTNGNVSTPYGFSRGYDFYTEMLTDSEGESVVASVGESLGKLADPFYLYLHFIDPHDPYLPETPWTEADEATGSQRDYLQPQEHFRGEFALDDTAIQRLIDQYDAEIRELDHALESLFLELQRRGLLDDTLVVVTSDHGEEFGEHGSLAHGSTLYDEVLNVPLIFWSQSPALPAGPEGAVMHHVDLMPTMLTALGASPPRRIDGRSRWRALLEGDDLRSRELYFHLDIDGYQAVAIQVEDRKLIRRDDRGLGQAYDLASTRREDRTVEHDALFESLRQQLMSRDRELRRKALDPVDAGDLDDEVRQQLEALGYLDDR